LAFSPDGKRLAVGYDDTQTVDVLSANDVNRLFSAKTDGITSGNLDIVGWTKDGALLAGGAYYDRGRPIFRWDTGGTGPRQALTAADNTVVSILQLPDGGFVYATSDPSIGRYDSHNRRQLERGPETS